MFARRRKIIAPLLILTVALFAGCRASAEQRSFDAQNPPLEVVANRFANEYTRQVVEGEIRNVSGGEMRDTQLVVEWLSATDRLIDVTVENLEDFAPNQSVRFRAEHPTSYRSVDVTQHRIRFQDADTRQVVPHRDLTGNQPGEREGGSGHTGDQQADPGGSGGAPVAPTNTSPH